MHISLTQRDSTLGQYLKEIKRRGKRPICTKIFTSALLVIAKKGKLRAVSINGAVAEQTVTHLTITDAMTNHNPRDGPKMQN